MIFQNPMTSLNPPIRSDRKNSEVFERHRGATRRQAMDRADCWRAWALPLRGCASGNIPSALRRLRQRVMIAMALMCDPSC